MAHQEAGQGAEAGEGAGLGEGEQQLDAAQLREQRRLVECPRQAETQPQDGVQDVGLHGHRDQAHGSSQESLGLLSAQAGTLELAGFSCKYIQ